MFNNFHSCTFWSIYMYLNDDFHANHSIFIFSNGFLFKSLNFNQQFLTSSIFAGTHRKHCRQILFLFLLCCLYQLYTCVFVSEFLFFGFSMVRFLSFSDTMMSSISTTTTKYHLFGCCVCQLHVCMQR